MNSDPYLMRDQVIESQTIKLAAGHITTLGPKLVLRHCRIECHLTARELVLIDVEFHHCTFVAKRQLTGYKFLRSRFYDCAFEGTFSGCDFGKRQDVYEGLGDMRRCSFSSARLDACRFFECDVATIDFHTKKPSIVFREPQLRLVGVDPGPISIGLQVFLDVTRDQLPTCSAVVDDVELAAKRLRVDPEDLLAFAAELDARSRPS